VLAVPADDPLVGEPAVELARVADRRFIAMSEGSSSRGFMMTVCARAGFTPNVVLETDDLFSVTGAVAAGIGAAVVPGRMGDQGHSGVALIPLIEPVPTRRTVCLAYRREPGHEAQLRALREVAQRYAATAPSLRPA
jgi:LysR family malonate utilization transcriptional regulator